MQPGLSRAIPMGLLGFLLGSLAVIILRGLQGITPLWDAGVGMTLAAFTTAGFFVWGMGAFNPAMSAHGEEADAVRARMRDNDSAPPRRILFGTTWQLATLVLILTVVLFGFASIPDGLTLTTTAVPEASLTQAGMVEMEIGGQVVLVSQLVIFAIFIIIMFLSLAAAAAVINWAMIGMSRGVAEAKVEAAGGGAAVLSAPEGEPAPVVAVERPTLLRRLRTVVTFVVLFVILYLVFYYVAIGLILPQPDFPGLNILFPSPASQLVVLSAVNAALFTVILLRPSLVLQVLGRIARFVSGLLRRVPNVLQ